MGSNPDQNDVFRAAASVYLHCVVLGSLPNAPPIAHAVEEVIAALQRDPSPPSSSANQDRSLLFSICVTAAVARDDTQRAYLGKHFHTLKASPQRLGGQGPKVSPLDIHDSAKPTAVVMCAVAGDLMAISQAAISTRLPWV